MVDFFCKSMAASNFYDDMKSLSLLESRSDDDLKVIFKVELKNLPFRACVIKVMKLLVQ